MPACLFVSDLHGNTEKYQRLLDVIEAHPPAAVFLGGDLLPNHLVMMGASSHAGRDFVSDWLVTHLRELRERLGEAYPRLFLILGNDDGRVEEPGLLAAEEEGLCEYLHGRRASLGPFDVYGYSCVPPTPFRLKDWERYDVSRYVDPGCLSPEEGFHTVRMDEDKLKYATIQDELAQLVGDRSLENAIMLFHSPPYQSNLDRAGLDGRMVDHVPLDVHVGSIAIQRLINNRQPLVTLHGHIHESARLTGYWFEQMGRTRALSAAHDGPELALVRFDPEVPEKASRTLL